MRLAANGAKQQIFALAAECLEANPQDLVEFADVEVVNARLVATGPAPKGELKKYPEKGKADDALKGARKVYFREAGGYWKGSARRCLHYE